MTAPTPFELIPFDPQAASPEQWALYHAFRRVRHAETTPDDPQLPDDVTEKLMKQQDPYEEVRRLAAIQSGRMVAMLYTDWYKPEAPAYESNAQFLWTFAGVERAARRQGIGMAMARQTLAYMDELGKSVFTTWSDEEDGYAYLTWLGARQVSVGAENRLDLQAVDWQMVDDWVRQGEARNPDVRLVLYEPRIPDEALEDFCPMFGALLNTMPFDDMDHGEIVVTPDTMRENYKRMDAMRASHHAYVVYEPDGSISAMTDIRHTPEEADRVSQRFTGVRPDRRGSGLGKWVKAAMLQHIRHSFPDARWVVTGNASSNDPMLAINNRLGFKEHRAGRTYQMTRDELAARLAEI